MYDKLRCRVFKFNETTHFLFCKEISFTTTRTVDECIRELSRSFEQSPGFTFIRGESYFGDNGMYYFSMETWRGRIKAKAFCELNAGADSTLVRATAGVSDANTLIFYAFFAVAFSLAWLVVAGSGSLLWISAILFIGLTVITGINSFITRNALETFLMRLKNTESRT